MSSVPPRRRISWRRKLLFSSVLLALGLLLAEGAAQLWFRVWQQPAWEKLKAEPNFYYRASDNALLGYELVPGKSASEGTRQLRINSQGVRDDRELANTAVDLLILGDSVVFGTGLTQTETLPALLEAALRKELPGLVVVNGGCPGYGLEELAAWNHELQKRFKPRATLLVLNPNDFARRHTRFEGADNGLFRMYHPPTLMLPWFIDKGLYRWHKGGKYASLNWYQWMFAGTSADLLPLLRGIKEDCDQTGGKLILGLYPAGTAYLADGHYGLQREEEVVTRTGTALGLMCLRPSSILGQPTTTWCDETDHPTPSGAQALATWLAVQLKPALSAPGESGPRRN